MRNPEISVVIPFYREGALISDSIDSVLNQSFKDFEIILIDNNADELTRNHAKSYGIRYPNQIRLIYEPQQGITFSKNSGILESRGRLISFLDGDDLMKPEKLQKQYEVINKRDDLVLVASNYDILSYDSSRILDKDIPSPAYDIQSFDRLINEYLILFKNTFSPSYLNSFGLYLPSTWLVRKEALVKSGLFNTNLNFGWDDYDLLMRLFQFGGFYKINESLSLYRAESQETRAQKNKSYNKKKRFISVQRYVASIWDEFDNCSYNISTLRKICSIWLQVFGLALIKYENGLKYGRTLFLRCVFNNPTDLSSWTLFLKSFMPRSLHPKLFWFNNFNTDSLIEIDLNLIKSFLAFPIKYDLDKEEYN